MSEVPLLREIADHLAWPSKRQSLRVLARELQSAKARLDAIERAPGHAHQGKCATDLCGWPIDPSRLTAIEETVESTNDRLDTHNRVSTSIVHRVRALESQARPSQESGELAVGREGNWQCRAEMAEARLSDSNAKCRIVVAERDEALRSAAIAKQDAQMFGGNYEVMLARVKEYEAERDAAIARADEAERDLVDAVATTQATATARDEYYRRFKFVEAERDVARDALRKIADPNIGLKYVRIIAKEALDGSGQHE